jgi:hypothetical protein
MKLLPDKFQMRTNGFPGFTHTVKLNAHGDYEVTWARGFDRKSYSMGRVLPHVVFTEEEVRKNVAGCMWYIVEDTPKQKEAEVSLPDEFYFLVEGDDELFKAKRLNNNVFHITWDSEASREGSQYLAEKISSYLKEGVWKIIDKKPLTAEQQRALKDFQEQVAQLDSSIKLNEQTIEHHARMIANYKSRQDDLRDKIAEIMGEELPSITKAKALKAELGKLKGNV